MTESCFQRLFLCAAMVGLCLGGCVQPGEDAVDVLTRYDKSLLERSPQRRMGDEGTAALKPVPGTTGIPFKFSVDPKTKRKLVDLSLEEAVRRTLLNSLDIRVVAFDPAITREQMVQAAAAFDAILFGGLTYNRVNERTDQRPPQPTTNSARIVQGEIGLKGLLPSGANWQVAWDITRTADNNPFFVHNPRYNSQFSAKIAQPLLRGSGTEYNLSQLYIARLNHKVTLAQFRQKIEETLARVEAGYWNLVQARRLVEIQQRLLDTTIETYTRVKERTAIDATAVEVKQTEAAVESRRAALVRARKGIMDAQGELVRFMADAQLTQLGGYEIIPTTPAVASQLKIDPTDQLVLAVRNNPLLEQARLAVATADINIRVAANETQPRLDLQASATLQELRGTLHNTLEEQFGDRNYVDYSYGLVFEYPIYNRAALAKLRQRRFERLKGISELQNTADQVAVAINESIRQIETTYEEVQAQRASVEAARVQLQALNDTEKIRGRLTPEFLQVKLQAQESLAVAEQAESQAVINFNIALASLTQVTGTALHQRQIKIAAEDAIEFNPWALEDMTPLPPITSPMLPVTAGQAATQPIVPK